MKKSIFFVAFALVVLLPGHKAGAQTVCSPTPPIGKPQLNIWPIANDGRDCSDYPLLAMRNVTQNSDYTYNSTISGNPGDILRVRLYVHNGVLDVDQNEAFNVMLAANLPAANGGGTVSASAWADNAAAINSAAKGGNMKVSLAPDQYLSYIPGSALNYGRGPVLLGGFSDNVVSGGASVGNMRGCFQYLHFVTFDVQVKQDETVPTGTVTVNSNIPTSWVISGPDNFSGTGTSGVYTNAKISGPDYFISVPNISGYKNPVVTPGFNQTLRAGQTINFNVYYEAETGPTPPPVVPPTPTPAPPPVNPPPPAQPLPCLENASVEIMEGIASPLAPGQQETFTVRVHNTGDTWFYHGSYFQFVQRTNLTISPTYGHISPSMPSGMAWDYRQWTFTLTAPTAPGDYTLTMQMVHRAFANYQLNDGTVCAPAKAFDTYFGEQANLKFTVSNTAAHTGSISVVSNIPTSWVISGPDNFSGTGTTATYTDAKISPPAYTAVFPVIAGYNPPVVSPAATQTLNPGQTITFHVNYGSVGGNPPPHGGPSAPPAPTVTADNSTCAVINLKWNDVSWETGYSVWRSTQAATGFTNVSGNLPANATSYSDSPAANRAYYYFVRPVNTTTGQQTDSKTIGPIMNKTCSANLDGSVKTLLSVTNHITGQTVPYDNSTVISAGDTLTFQITIANNGTAAAQITSILDIPSGNLANLRHVQVNKGTGFVPVSNSGNTINVSGSKGVGGSNWLVRYDMTATSLTSSNAEPLKNCATIRYTDPQGNGEVTKCFGPILARQGSGVPIFREMAP
jgi:uncharacterized repeat protein (TIGR01451 family)